jgi:Na+-driven multidrug efflux pump
LYKTLNIVSFILLSLIAMILFITKEIILKSFTNDSGILDITLRIVYLNCLIVLPDSYKGMLKGTIKSLGL